MKKIITLVAILAMISGGAFAQKNKAKSKTQAKAVTWAQLEKSDGYVYGTGRSTNLNEADRMAKEDLVVSITGMMYSHYGFLDNLEVFGETNSVDTHADLRIKSFLTGKTYAPRKLTISKPKDKLKAIAYYMSKDDVVRFFNERGTKVSELVETARKNAKAGKVTAAMNCYHNALAVLATCPDGDKLQLDGGDGLAYTRIPEEMAEVLSRISLTVESVEKADGGKLATIAVRYDGKPTDDLRLSYSDGDQINIEAVTTSEGVGQLHLTADVKEKKMKLTAALNYIDENVKSPDSVVSEALALSHVPLIPQASQLPVTVELKKGKRK